VTIATLRDRLRSLAGRAGSPALLCVTGASGAGKTAAIEHLRDAIEPRLLPTLSFDSLGVPSAEAMLAGWESPRGWQKAMTWHWVQTARNVYRTHPLVVLEGQFDPQYAIAACSANRMRTAIVLLHADDSVRRERVKQRGQPELATDDMNNWASYLQEQTKLLGGVVLDASRALGEVVAAICGEAVSLVDSDEPTARNTPRRIN
jgi:hypothetical protein